MDSTQATREYAHAFDNIDRLLTVEMRPQGLDQGLIPQLHAFAKQEHGSLIFAIATALQNLPPGRVVMLTGVYLPEYFPRGEIDGPIGAVVLGSVLAKLGHEVDVYVEEQVVPVIEALLAVMDVPGCRAKAAETSEEAVRAYAAGIDALVSVEKLGWNRQKVTHSIIGTPITTCDPLGNVLVDELNGRGKLTIGIGDGGNEIGFGKIFDYARQIVPPGANCGCPCGDGSITSTATSFVLPACVSNFGAYAIAAGLSILREEKELCPTAELIGTLIRIANEAGCIDGGTVDPNFLGDDGIPLAGVQAWVQLLNTIVNQHFTVFDRHF